MPDELLTGYRARIAAINEQQSPLALAAQLIAASGQTKSNRDSTCALIHLGAKAGGLSPFAFLAAHSNFRINSTPGDCLLPRELDSRLTSIRVSQVNSTSTVHLRACRECINEDLRADGFAYWRRSHHLPGRYVCPQHDVALHLVKHSGTTPALPDVAISTGVPAENALLRHTRWNPFVGRFNDHLTRVVSGHFVLQKNDVTASLRRTLHRHGEPFNSYGWSTVFASRIASAFSFEWLQRALSNACTSTDAIALSFVRPLFYDYSHMSHPTYAVLASMAADSGH